MTDKKYIEVFYKMPMHEFDSYSKNMLISYSYQDGIPSKIEIGMRKCNLLFTYLLFTKNIEYTKFTPYTIRIKNLVPYNQWSQGHFVALNQDDGTLQLSLNYEKILEMDEFPVDRLTWVLLHEFRHKIQLNCPEIKSVIDFGNWNKFKEYMINTTGKDEDTINHVFHELNPEEVDANIFACEVMCVPYMGSSFNLTDEKLELLI